MRLHSIIAKNYRTLQNITLTFPMNYCAISGRNNAGKSCVIRLLSALFGISDRYPWIDVSDIRFDYKEDKTQWVKQTEPILIEYTLDLTRQDDPALISFIEKIASTKIAEPKACVRISYTFSEKEDLTLAAAVNNENTDEKAAKEIDKRIKDSNLLFLYNSATSHHERHYFSRYGRPLTVYDLVMSAEEKKRLEDAGKHVERRLRRLAKDHTRDLGVILERLTERYDVELSTPERYSTRSTPLSISLRDRNVEVPLDDWGSGTQNRTHALMAILQAKRVKTTDSPDERITPFVVIEEPESFLHPSAQAEFGRALRALSSEFGIQIIATTHSPYMLNLEEPASNILLSRNLRRRKAYETVVVSTTGSQWMAPFSEHLGLAPEEFWNWRAVFSSYKSRVLLVEGTIDQEYFQFLQKHVLSCDCLAPDVEVVPYGGKDTLKNTLLVQFVLRTFDRVFVTYDLDAEGDVRSALNRVGLKEKRDYLGLGLDQPGKDCLEGLLPQGVLAAVNGRETDLVPLGVPPALPGRHKKFDSSGSPSRTLDDVSRQAHAEEVCDGREQKPKPYEVGVQISCGVYSQVPAQSAV